ncbi:MAG: hypothetical protein IJW65_02750 [Clostridia bacterium]|nr:hypothetical protein [Clostridia bacterium]
MKSPKESCSYYIDLLCARFRNRGIAEKAQADAESDRRREKKLSKRYASGTDVSPKSRKYKTGVHEGKPYTSSDDFARYYSDLRGNKRPDAKPRDEEEYKKAIAELKKETKLQSKKEMRLAVRRLMGQKCREIGLIPPSPKKLIEATNKGFFADEPEDRRDAKRTGMPRGVLSTVLLVALSLFLIVTSSVMVSRAESDVSRLESELEELRELDEKLKVDLEVKNNMVDIKEIAEEQYGMVSAEYTASRYVYIEREDKIVTNSETRVQSAFVTLLEALGLKTAD